MDIQIDLPKRLGLRDIQGLVHAVLPALEAYHAGREFLLTVNMRRLEFITPTCLAMLAALLRLLTQSSVFRGGAFLPSHNDGVEGYLGRMDFYKCLDLPYQYTFRRNPSEGRFHELLAVDSEDLSLDVARHFHGILESNGALPPEFSKVAVPTIQELMDNVFHHAESSVNAIVCAQAYEGTRVELAIADCGIGFRKSLMRNQDLVGKCETGRDALRLAVQPKVTGRPDHNAGEGLFFITELAKQNHGEMIIYSDDGIMNIRNGRVVTGDAPHWPGSVVGLSLNLNREADMGALFDKYAPPGNGYEFDLDAVFNPFADEG
ncbi:MAG: hypothetical protein ACYC2Y_10565 [Armatimonadota bacterium]